MHPFKNEIIASSDGNYIGSFHGLRPFKMFPKKVCIVGLLEIVIQFGWGRNMLDMLPMGIEYSVIIQGMENC